MNFPLKKHQLSSVYKLFILLTFFLCSFIINAQPLRIAVSANFHPVLVQLLPIFKQQNIINNSPFAHQSVELISAASGVLHQQIRYGAPFDIFLSADSLRPQQLIDENKALSSSLITYAVGQLSLWSNNNAQFNHKTSIEDILSSETSQPKHLAIANPNTAPYGKASKEVLNQLNLWQSYQHRLITGININQTFQQVRSGSAPLGIVATSQLILNNFTNGIPVSQQLYSPIKQQGVILKRSKQVAFAQRFMAFLQSAEIQQQLTNYGYLSGTSANNIAIEHHLKASDEY